MRKTNPFVAGILATLALTSVRATAQSGFAACEVRGIEGPARCGSVTVPEAPESRRTISLNVLILPATGPDYAPDPLFYLAGGPGQAATDLAQPYAPLLAEVRRSRDLVFIDQRGTGRSAPLGCPIADPAKQLRAMMAFDFPVAQLAACRASYDADLEWYGTTQFVGDLERVRETLGYERVNLLGASYGTRVGLQYMRLHPQRIRSAVLAGVAPPGFRLGESFAADADSALARVGRECAAQPECAEVTPDFGAMTRATAARLDGAPVHVPWARRPDGDTVVIVMDRPLFVGGIRFLLYAGSFVANLPRIVRDAHDGDFGPLVTGIGAFAGLLGAQISVGLFLSDVCTEDVARIDSAAVARSSAGTLLRTAGIDGLINACRDWPHLRLPAGFDEPVRTAVPTLMFSGDADPITPPWHAARQAALLPNARHVITPNASHVDLQACEFGIIAAFIASGSAADLDVSCSEHRPPRRFATK